MMQPSTPHRYLCAVAASGLLALAFLTPTARAEIPRTGDEPWYRQPTANIERAKELFAQAVSEHLQLLRGNAKDLYDQALVLWDNPDIRWNLALVLEDLGQYLHAHDQLERATRWGEALGAERLHDVHDRMNALEVHHLARIEASCNELATDVTLDGQSWFQGSGRGSMLVEPGEHYVVARKLGFFPVARSISVAAGQDARLDLPMDEDRLIETRRWAAWKPWAAIAAGVVLTATGAVLDGQAILNRDNAAKSLPSSCDTAMGCTPTQAPRSYGRAVTEHRIALSALATGGTTTALGLVLVWMNQAQVHRSEARPLGSIEITPVLSTSLLGISAQRQF